MLAVTVPADDVGCQSRRPPSYTGAIRIYRRGPAGWALSECLTTTPRHPSFAFLSADGERLVAGALDAPPRTLSLFADRLTTHERSDAGWVTRGDWRIPNIWVTVSPDLELIFQQFNADSSLPAVGWRWPGSPLPAPRAGPNLTVEYEAVSSTRLGTHDRSMSYVGQSVQWHDFVDGGWHVADEVRVDGGVGALGSLVRLHGAGALFLPDPFGNTIAVVERDGGRWTTSTLEAVDAGPLNVNFESVDACLRTVAILQQPDAVVIFDRGP